MEIKISRDILLDHLELVKDATASSNINPILSNVLIRVKDKTLTMVATNNEVQITAKCPTESKEDFERLIPATKLQNILRALDADALVVFDFGDDEVTLTCDHSVFKLNTQKKDDFVLLGESSDMDVLETMQTTEIISILQKVVYASAIASHRMNLNGVLMERQEDSIVFVATDGHRLAIKSVSRKSKGKKKAETKHILPRRTVEMLISRLKREGEVKISGNDRAVRFKSDDFELTTNIIDDAYPDYQAVIPRNNDKSVIVERKILQAAMRRVTALADKMTSVVFTISENRLDIKCTNKDNDTSTDWVDVKYASEQLEVGFNLQFILDVLNATEEDMIEISLVDSSGSVLITPMDSDETFQYIVMPIHLN